MGARTAWYANQLRRPTTTVVTCSSPPALYGHRDRGYGMDDTVDGSGNGTLRIDLPLRGPYDREWYGPGHADRCCPAAASTTDVLS